MKIPFYLTLRGIVLSGKDREKARINYELSGEERERELLALDYNTDELRKLKEYRIKKLELDKKYNKISDMDYELELAKLNIYGKSDTDVSIDELDVLLKYNKITNIEYCIRKNDILKKPWVAIKTDYDETNDPDNLEIEVAYNKTFIEKMRKKGLPGDTDEEIAEQWLKLFMISNLDDDDFSMIDENTESKNKKIVKMNDNKSILF